MTDVEIMKRASLTSVSDNENTPSIQKNVARVAAIVAEEIVHATSTGRLPEDFDVAAFARRAIASVPRSNELADSIGDFYDTAGLVEWLSVSKQALAKRVAKHQMVGCKTADGHWVYPAWQFNDTGEVIHGVPEVLDVLLQQQDEWAAALWLVSPSPALGELSAVDWLSSGQDLDVVVADARRDTERLAS